LLFTTSLSLASETLEPEDSAFSGVFLEDYTKMVLDFFREIYGKDILLRMVAFPSFHPEFAVGIRESAGVYSVLRLAPRKQLWAYKTKQLMETGQITHVSESGHVKTNEDIERINNEYPSDYREVPIDKCSAPLDESIARGLRDVWSLMLLETRYSPDPRLGLDGADYHFSMRVTQYGGIYAGKIWSPPEESKPGRLVAIGNSLADYCMKASERREIESRLRKQVNDLLKALHSKKP
jgi:hypothetical protein